MGVATLRALVLLLASWNQISVVVSRQLARTTNVSSTLTTDMSPVRKVITLIEEMKVQVEKDAETDMAAYDKYMCWCDENEKEKTAAITAAQANIERLSAFIEEAAATMGMLKTEISTLETDIAEDQDAVATATSTREKEQAAFQSEESDMKETRQLLAEAIEILSKVQLLQKNKAPSATQQAKLRSVMLQVQKKAGSKPSFAGIMQRDFFDFMGSLEVAGSGSRAGFLRAAAIQQSSRSASISRLLPWEKTEEQKGKEEKPNELEGAAANSKSYNSRSGGIAGLLSEMRDQFTRDLADSQKQDFEAEVSFQNLRAAKLGEIQAGIEAKKSKEAQLADTQSKSAAAKEDRESTSKALDADQGFLANMKEDCRVQDEEYKSRSKTRGDEIVALAETIKILTTDQARDLYAKTVTLLQVDGSISKSSSVSEISTSVQEAAADRAMQRIAAVARKHKSWSILALAVRVRLDAFSKVKEALDKMLAELKKQQKEEVDKRDFCNKEIDHTEDEITVGENTKEDLAHKHQALVNALQQLSNEIDELKADESENMVSLKAAGEQRKDQNQQFQTAVSDQRATINILNKAQKRLKMFYTPELVQEPGKAVSPKPDTPKDYSKSSASGGVMQLIAKVISNAEVEENELVNGEQRAQTMYSEFVQATQATIEANRKAIAQKTALTASTNAEKSETEEAQLANEQELATASDLLKAQHMDCDWVLKYFTMRQQARGEEMEAIADAKAVLSGADFGK